MAGAGSKRPRRLAALRQADVGQGGVGWTGDVSAASIGDPDLFLAATVTDCQVTDNAVNAYPNTFGEFKDHQI